ncbi:MAG: hypothetical protein M3O35_09900, partial [Acidobacteriota bacterium]|nr:hypothetical protein [Acidobacteriota bacterium]
MSDGVEDFDAVLKRVLAEFADKSSDRKLNFKEAYELREYVKARTNLQSQNLTTEQGIWKSLYDRLTEQLRNSSPENMAEIEANEKEVELLKALRDRMAASMKSRPHDFGVQVWWGFITMG